ncbi:hypothetical protein GCM10010495_35810 [Kitasatospora herbaricolor]|nr:hypothetical protein GCM10010495_35810 [Kitasatospora herbaricolor]
MQDDPDGGQPVSGRVLADALGGLGQHLVTDRSRPGPPRGVGVLVDITVIAGKIAATVHFHNELRKGQQIARHIRIDGAVGTFVPSDRGIERGDRHLAGACARKDTVQPCGDLFGAQRGQFGKRGSARLRLRVRQVFGGPGSECGSHVDVSLLCAGAVEMADNGYYS